MLNFESVNLEEIKSLVGNKNIEIVGKRSHLKASEIYVDVNFKYPENDYEWKGSVPIEYRRTGVSAQTSEEISRLLQDAYDAMHPDNYNKWLKEQEEFWSKNKKEVTQSFFDGLKDFKWKCIRCELPENPNWARRFQDIKEFGYTTATNTNKFCEKCNRNTTQLILLPLPRGFGGGYETWSPGLRGRIIKIFGNIDAYENRKMSSLLPDHKFPEIRWDEETMEGNPNDMNDEEIKNKFQLLSNQRNQQKREVCRKCYQTGKRGYPHGIKFFYEGSENWGENIPKKGKKAERGCIGCGWYDLQRWREELNKKTNKKD